MTTESLAHPLDGLRARYPSALVCLACLTILATRAASYARSGLTEPERLSYVCAECRADQAEADGLRARRAAVGRANLERARAAIRWSQTGAGSRQGIPETGTQAGADWEGPSRAAENRGVAGIDNRHSGSDGLLLARAGERLRRRGYAERSVRVRRHASEAEAHRARQRAYRARTRLALESGAR